MPRKKRQVKLFTLDTETIGLDGAIRRIAIYDGTNVRYGYEFNDIEHYLQRAYDDGYAVHIYIHNLDFDARKIPRLFEKGNIVWDKTKLIGGRYAIISCKEYTIHDSFKLLPESLDSLSKSFQLEHGKMDLWEEVQKEYPGQYIDKVDFLSNCPVDDPIYLKYLGFDVISLYELIEKLCEISGLTHDEIVNRMSTASLSKYIFKKGYKGHIFQTPGQYKTDYEIMTQFKGWTSTKIQPCGISYMDMENKIREGYYGGRTEVFIPHVVNKGPGEISAYHYDVNSLYPSVMVNEVPVGMPEFINDPDMVKIRFEYWMREKAGLGFVKADVFIPQQFIPPVPARMGKLVFPTGHITGTWTYIELEYAIKNCGVVVEKYHEMIHFKKTFPVFKNFIETFSSMKSEAKKNGEKALEKFTKLVQNTGYGYVMLRRDDKDELKDISKLEQYEDRLNYSNEEMGYINIKSIVITESIQPQVGAYITSYARLVLLDMLRRQADKGQVYYCDTDSIVCEHPLDRKFVDKTKLGLWDLEGELVEALFLFPKVYTEHTTKKETIKFKGVSRTTQKDFDFDFYQNLFDKLADGSTDDIVVERDKELLRSLAYRQKTGTDWNALEIRDKKVRLGNKQKRNMDYANNSSMPWFMETLEMFESFSFSTKPKNPEKPLINALLQEPKQ